MPQFTVHLRRGVGMSRVEHIQQVEADEMTYDGPLVFSNKVGNKKILVACYAEGAWTKVCPHDAP
jgi:hypothetical protein